MAVDNINDLESAEIRINENGELDDLFIAVFKDNTMNFTKISNLPVYANYQIDAKIKDFEKAMTLKMQEQNIVNKIYTKDPNSGDIVESYLTLEEIADKMNSNVYKEVGVRFNISATTGNHTTYTGKVLVRRGDTTLISGVDPEPTAMKPAFSYMNSEGEEIISENIFARDYYPWNSMKKMQISMDNTNYNYDMSIDNGGNYFTEVPLYYIKQQYIIEEQVTVEGSTGVRYRPILDITGIWNSNNPLDCIPEKYQSSSYCIGMYKWVCEYPLYGYRPASFFVNKVNKLAEVDDGTYGVEAERYVKVNINNEDYFILYKKYLEGNLITEEVPVLYCLEATDASGYNNKILDPVHRFGCYEMSTETYDGKTVAVSKPGLNPRIGTTMASFRTYMKNLGKDYFMQDLRSRTDFYGHLMDIEYGTLHCQSVCNGFSGGIYNAAHTMPLTQTAVTNMIILSGTVVDSIVPGQCISAGASLGSYTLINRAIYESSELLESNVNFSIDDSVNYYRSAITDGVPEYSTDASTALDDTIYYKANIDTVGDIYVAVISAESEVPTAQSTDIGIQYQVYYCTANNYLYIPMSTVSKGRLYKVFLDREINKNLPSGTIVFNMSWITGSTDVISERNGTRAPSLTNTKYAFKWNWIENPYANIWKFIDGCHISHHETEGFDTPHNTIWVCDIPEYYNSDAAHTNYTKITSYVLPGKEGYCGQLGYDPLYPWVQLTSKIQSTIYSDYFYQNASATSSAGSSRCLFAGGYWTSGAFAGLRCFRVNNALTYSGISIGASLQKRGV